MLNKYKWPLYIFLLLASFTFYAQQFIVEQWLKLQLRNEHIVVSFTTTPQRIDKLQHVTQSLLQQNASIKAIYLNIPDVFKRDNSTYQIPAWLQSEPRITILRGTDYGPATKLLGTLANVNLPQNAIIVTVDDDIIYPKNLVLHLAYKALKNPNTAIAICGANPAINSPFGIVKDITPNAQVSIVQGFAGIAYRRRFFDDQIFAIQNAPRECSNSDDLYLSFYLAKHAIPRQVLYNKYMNYYDIHWHNELGLNSDALHMQLPNMHDKHVACIEYLRNNEPNVDF